ncbi:MAG: N-acetyl-gamma-glutamyl-phosphate reductase [Flavobacteriaceae bacterium]|nr:N-acetyl-gamma-glutamyl-phosphate reductase [Flavobacteriaceae bacterium]NNL80617.1 N-acetyl-gamma-glutamyl-phosphate reductase [Flavobacteriaceae bacterium]
MIKVGIIGGSGYTSGELLRLLVNHPYADIKYVYSSSIPGKAVGAVHQDLEGQTDLKFTDTLSTEIDVLFLCMGHGMSRNFLTDIWTDKNVRVIDLSRDFRLKNDTALKGENFVYGLPELNKEKIKAAKYIANPGCFATAIELGLLPLAHSGKLKNDVHVNAVTGATGAGASVSGTSHFPWRDNNFSSYKPFTHQHLDEIIESVIQLQPGFGAHINFIPNRGNFSRGIFATIYSEFNGSLEDAYAIYDDYYADHLFTIVSKNDLHLKQVVNTNNCKIHLHKHENLLLISSAIDNLLKGASGQAVQNMNLMFDLNEEEGLRLKATYF